MFGDRLINITGQFCSLRWGKGIKVCEWLRKIGHGRISLSESGLLADGCSMMFKNSLVKVSKKPKLIYEDHYSLVSVQALLLS